MPGKTKRDPYAVLGVARDADRDTIRKAYRKLAREFHPDVNPDDAVAEERFKQVSEAYSVLSDPDKRSAYDEFGDIALDPNFDAQKAREARAAFGGGFPGADGAEGGASFGGFGGIEDLFSNLFSQGAERGPGGRPFRRAGVDVEAELVLEFIEAALGCEKRVTIARPTADGGARQEAVTIRIPPGVADGGQIRLRGKGGEAVGGGPPGDLFARVRVRPHPTFRREGRDIHLDVPITIREAVLGAKVEIPTLTGRATVSIPPGTDGGARLRLRGKGIPKTPRGPAGDLFVNVQIRVPNNLDAADREEVEKLACLDVPDLRRDLG